jgi:hypothetical protein
MIEATRKKLGEARFFYQHLVNDRQQKTFRHDPDAFRYYFSAFIQAARSVTWTLGKEEKEKWKAWKPKWESMLAEEDKKLLAFTKLSVFFVFFLAEVRRTSSQWSRNRRNIVFAGG